MARVAPWTLGSYLWGDKTLQSLQFADDGNAHVHPQAQDIDLNSLIADYFSLTAGNQQVKPTIIFLTDVVGSQAPIQILTTDLLRGWTINPNNGAPVITAEFQTFDSPSASFLNVRTQTGQPSNTFAGAQNLLGMNAGALVLGDDGTFGGVNLPGPWLILTAFPNPGTPLNVTPGVTGSIGTTNKLLAFGDHTHNLSLNSLASNIKQDALAANAGALTTSVPRSDHIHKALVGAVALVNADETQANATVPNADTVLKTYTLAANTYSKIIAEAEGYGTFGALSTNQVISLKVKFAGAQVGITMKLDAALGAASNIPFSLKASAAFAGGGAVDITQSAPAADANTTMFLNSLRVYGVV